jgi:AcrR family transcriptional regulator
MARPRSFDRDAALEQAMLLFWERGYDETSIGDLTAAMGIAAPSLYAAFGDKQRLFEEAAERYEALPGAPLAVGLQEPTARGAVERVLALAAREYTLPTHPPGCFVNAEPRLGERRAAGRAALLARFRAAPELPEGTDPAALADYVQSVLAGMSAQARDGGTREELEAVAAVALRAVPD